jgi:O-antigen ligase
MCAVPVSIAVAEIFLAASLLFRLIEIAQHRAKLHLPRVFWFWLAWAVLEVVAWLGSPALRAGKGEMRHLLLIAVLFLLVPTLKHAGDRVTVWCGIVLAASLSSLFLIGNFVWQLLFYRGTLDPIVALRGGGLLHHWMVYGIVEILVVAGLLELWHYFPEKHRWLLPVSAINAVAILLSLTRMVWICALLLLVLHLLWRRSAWLWAVPVIPCALFFLSPAAVRTRVTDSMHLDYYSNAERVQMLQVGWKMIQQHPLTGVGPGRVDELYPKYLSASDPLPAYHGHLHNNLVQLAAEFGLPATMAALLFVTVLFLDLRTRCRLATDRDQQFLCRTSILGLTGFLVAGLFDYTYGHSLGLIMLSFVVLSPLTQRLPATE